MLCEFYIQTSIYTEDALIHNLIFLEQNTTSETRLECTLVQEWEQKASTAGSQKSSLVGGTPSSCRDHPARMWFLHLLSAQAVRSSVVWAPHHPKESFLNSLLRVIAAKNYSTTIFTKKCTEVTLHSTRQTIGRARQTNYTSRLPQSEAAW